MTDEVASPVAAVTPSRLETLQAAMLRAFPEGLSSVANHAGELTYEVPSERWLAVAATLRDHAELKFDMCMDVCGIDYLEHGRAEWKTEDATSSGYSRGVSRGMARPPLLAAGVMPWCITCSRLPTTSGCDCGCSAPMTRSPWWIR